MNIGQTIYISNYIVILDIEVSTNVFNNHRISEICVTDIFGKVLLHNYECTTNTIYLLQQILSNKVVIAFDSIQDHNFLLRECEFLNIPLNSIKWFCAKNFFEKFYNVNCLSLKKVCSIARLKYPNHTAKDDCLALARVLRKVIKLMAAEFKPEYRYLMLAILQASQEAGMDHLPVADTLNLTTLIKEIEDDTALGRQYLELFRNCALDELTKRGAFATNVDILKRTDPDNNVT